MSGLTLFLLQLIFLCLLWFFVFFIVYSLRADLFGDRVRKLIETGAGSRAVISSGGGSADDGEHVAKLVISSGPKEGTEILLSDEPITIGRSADCSIILRDDFTSTHHARLLPSPEGWILQDLDSTNGTLVNGKRVHSAVVITTDTEITIGKTTFELRN